MRYESPRLTVLTAAINVVHSNSGTSPKATMPVADSLSEETIAAYQDWE